MSEQVRKSFTTITWQVDDDEFRSTKMYSYSRLSRFAKEGPTALVESKSIDTESLRFGSLVDCLLTSPEELESEFIICDFKKPPQKVMDLLKYIWENGNQNVTSLTSISDEVLLSAANLFNYLPSYSAANRITRIRESGRDYFRLLGMGNKPKVTPEDVQDAKEVVKILETHPYTSIYLNLTPEELISGSVEILFQVKVCAKFNGIPIKGKLDILVVDHNRKIIYPIDLKTTGKDESNFESSFIEFNYYIQAEMYSYILESLIKEDDYFKEFTVAPFKFMVINRFHKKPLIWEWNPKDPEIQQVREELIKRGMKPWYELVLDAYYHDSIGRYDYPREALQNNGKMTINLKHPFYKKEKNDL